MSETETTQGLYEELSQEQMAVFPYQMTSVRLIELHARWCESDEDLEPTSEVALLGGPEDPEKEFVEALRFHVVYPGEASFELSVTLEGQFEAIVEPSTIDQGAVRRFTSHDIISILWPYLRETVHNITERMHLSLPPLPIVDVRNLVVSEEETQS